jgi:phosphate acetyltransferase
MSDEQLVNRTFDDIRLGDSASVVRSLTSQDLRLFAAISGDVNPAHIDQDYMNHFLSGRLVGHSLWSAALISGVLGNKLPGPGTVYESQELRFLRPVRVGDTVTATVTTRAKRADGRSVEFDCQCVNQHGEIVAVGVAVVRAPIEHVCVPRLEPPEVAVQAHSKYEALLKRCHGLSPARTAVAYPCDETSLAATVEAAAAGLLEPILVGPSDRIAQVAALHNFDTGRFHLVTAADDREAAARAVELVRNGEAEMLIKGALHTDVLMHEVIQSQTGLRRGRRLSQAYLLDVPSYHKPLILTDCAINIFPTLEDKVSICQNAIDLAQTLGVALPKVAILSAVETVNPKIPATVDAAALCKMADRGQISGGLLDGPLAMDNAISKTAAEVKHIRSEVAGDADVLVAPDLEAGNMLAKQLTFMANADAAGIVLGARVPIILTSRSDKVRTRLASCAVGLLLVHARNTDLSSNHHQDLPDSRGPLQQVCGVGTAIGTGRAAPGTL